MGKGQMETCHQAPVQIFVQPGQMNAPHPPQPPPVVQPAQPVPQYAVQQPQLVQPVQPIPPQYQPQQPQIVQPVQPVCPQFVVQQPQLVQPVQPVCPQFVVQQPQLVQPVNQVAVVRKRPTDTSGQMMCPHCQNTVVTVVQHENGVLTWLICGIVGFFILWPLCLIPFCVDSCKDVAHYCPTCSNKLYVYKRM